MLNLSERYPLVFFHIPKNAGKSICKALEINKKYHPPLLDKTVLLGDDIRNSYTDEQWNSLVKFTVVRNPWDRMVSLYSFRKKERDLLMRLQHKGLWNPEDGDLEKDWDFKKWISTPEIAGVTDYSLFTEFKHLSKNTEYLNFYRSTLEYLNQVDIITDSDYIPYVNFILRFESLLDDWKKMSSDLNIELPDLPVVNTSRHSDYSTFYDDETRKLVYGLFEKDIETFKYTF